MASINQQIAQDNPSLVNDSFVQKIHYTNPMGRSNDIQSIVPHYNSDGKIDYWDGYYLWDVKSSWGNQWYHFKTKDFGKFTAFDENDLTSIKNVAIPDKAYDFNGKNKTQVDFKANPHPLSWTFVATGSVLKNNTKKGGQPWFTVDQWGNPINPDAKIACFSTFGNWNATHLAYSNNDEQFHPISENAEIDSTMVNRSLGDEFRDPQLITDSAGEKLICYEAGGLSSKIFPLTSKDGFHWEHNINDVISIDTLNDVNFKARMIETPFVTTINNQPLMFFGIQNSPDRGQPYGRSYSHVGWVAGKFKDNGIFTFDPDAKHGFVDDGFDNYAGNFTKIDDKTLVYVGWMGNWGYFNGNHAGNFTLSRIITWDSYKGIQSKIVEPGSQTNSVRFSISAQQKYEIPVGKRLFVQFKKTLNNFNIYITRKNNEGNRIVINFNNGVISYSRNGSWNGATDMSDSSDLKNGKTLGYMSFYLDNISVEANFPEAKKIYTFFSFDQKDNPYVVSSDVDIDATTSDFNLNKSPGGISEIDNVRVL